MSVGVMIVGVMSVGEITVGVMTVGVMRRPPYIRVDFFLNIGLRPKLGNIYYGLCELKRALYGIKCVLKIFNNHG